MPCSDFFFRVLALAAGALWFVSLATQIHLWLPAATTLLLPTSAQWQRLPLAAARRCRPGSTAQGLGDSIAPAVRLRCLSQQATEGGAAEVDVVDEDKEDGTLYFGGVSAERGQPEETETMRVASRINQALVMKRSPEPAPLVPAETGWYDELGVAPTATQEELTLRYLAHAEEVEERLAFLLESSSQDDLDDDEGDEDEDAFTDGEQEEGDGEQSPDEEDEAITLQPNAGTLDAATGPAETDGQTEAETIALNFMRLSNLYQILSVPQLRRIYDQGGVDGLAMRSPHLHKGLLEPEKVLKIARGKTLPQRERVSLLLRREPREQNFQRYQSKNSIKQVLRRLTDVFRVWCFQSSKSLQFRKGTIYEQLPEVCVLGRVNSGKSSLIQHLLSAGKMRRKRLASVAQWPGKTRGIDVFCVNRRFTIADVAGHGRGNSEHESGRNVREDWKTNWEPLLKEYLKTTHWLRAAIYVHDIGKDIIKADLDVLNLLKRYNIPTLLVLTKDDKVDSDTHRMSRIKSIRQALKWSRHLPHAHYTTRKGGYGQLFKNMLGTMLLGLVATEQRTDAWEALKTELVDVFFDYRDKYVPRPRGPFGKLPTEKKVRTYPMEDKVYTEEDLAREERELERQERQQVRKEQKAAGYVRTLKDDIEEVAGEVLTPRERRKRWEQLLQTANQ